MPVPMPVPKHVQAGPTQNLAVIANFENPPPLSAELKIPSEAKSDDNFCLIMIKKTIKLNLVVIKPLNQFHTKIYPLEKIGQKSCSDLRRGGTPCTFLPIFIPLPALNLCGRTHSYQLLTIRSLSSVISKDHRSNS